MSRQDIRAFATIGVVILVGVVLVMLLGLSNAVTAQESDYAPPVVSVPQSDNATSTPIIIDPPDSDDPESDEVTGLSAPSRPGRPSVSGVGHNAITLSWGAVSGATHYDARYRDRDAGGVGVAGSWSQTNNIQGTTRTFSGLSPSTRYEFEVRAGNAAGDSSWSPNRYGTTTAAPISLSLPDPSDRTLTKDVSTSFTLPSARGGTAPYSYSVSGLPAGLSFTALSRTVSGTPSATGTSTVTYSVTDSASPAATRTQTFTITVTTGAVPSAPGRPSVTGTTQTSVSLSWGAVTGATHYDARYRDRDAGGTDIPGSWSQTNDISGTSQTFSELTPSTRYEFEVRAGNAVGDSAWSLVRYGTTKPSTPTPGQGPTPTDTPTPTPTDTPTPTPTPPPPPPPSNTFRFVYQKADVTFFLGKPINRGPSEYAIFPMATGASGSVTYDLEWTAPRGVDWISRFFTGVPTELSPAQTVTYKATDSSTNDTISQQFALRVADVPNVGTFAVDIRVQRVFGRTVAANDARNLSATEYLPVLTEIELEIVDPISTPLDPDNPMEGPTVDFDSYEFRLVVPKATGFDIADGCNYAANPSRNTGWLDENEEITLTRCRLGDGTTAISLDARVREVSTREGRLLSLNTQMVQAPHHSDSKATYRLCNSMPSHLTIDFEDEIDDAADLWDKAGVGITFPEGTDVTSCDDFTNGVIDVFYVPTSMIKNYCNSSTAYACLWSDEDRASDVYYKGQWLVFKYPLGRSNRWGDDRSKAEKDSTHVYVESIMAHEFGHAGGLEHVTSSVVAARNALLRSGYSKDRLDITDYDKTAMKAIYK